MNKKYINNRLHLAVQHKIASWIGKNECVLEHRVKEHIADIYWQAQNTVFEVQCSPISLKEASRRTKDFEKLKINIIWILHQKTYNKVHMSPAETYLVKNKKVYYCNISQSGDGIVFDQEEAILFHKRLHKTPPQEVLFHLPRKKFFSKNLYFSGDIQETPLLQRMRLHPDIWKKKTVFYAQQMQKKALYYFTALKWIISLG